MRRAGALFVSFAGVLGGAERVALEWARAVEGRVVLACPPGSLADAAVAAGIEPVPIAERPLGRRGRSGRAVLDLAELGRDVSRLIQRLRPAVVVASGQRPLLATAWAPLFGARLVALEHDVPVNRALLAAAARRARAVVATSAIVAAGGRAEVIRPGVDLARWDLPDPPADSRRVLLLGALVAVKRPDLALEIVALVPEAELDVVGTPLPGDDPGLERALRARAARGDLAGRVRFLGALDDPRPAMAEARCLLHCADREGFGLAVVEALAAGRPVVAPAAGGAAAIVTPACGRLFAPGDAESGAVGLRSAMHDAGAPAAARERAAAFDGAAAAQRFAAVIARVAAVA